MAVGGLVCWLWALRPAVRVLDEDQADAVRDRVYSLTLIGVVIAAGGSLLALSVQSANAGGGYGPSGIHRRTWVFMDHYVPWSGISRVYRPDPDQPSLFDILDDVGDLS